MATQQRQFQAGLWTITVVKSHILRSSCERGGPVTCQGDNTCTVCRFSRELSLPSLPEMVFPLSALQLQHVGGARVEFLALEALRLVDTSHDLLKVAVAHEWSKAHAAGLQEVKEVVKPFDWTFTTDYKGTLTSGIQVCETEEQIDYTKLKQQEKILFFDEVILFEDELADNGTAVLSVKIRVMASGFFVLMRFFLRVDGVLVRMNETRLYHQTGSSHLLREYCSKEAKLEELKVPGAWLTDPNKLNDVLPITQAATHKLSLATDSGNTPSATAAT